MSAGAGDRLGQQVFEQIEVAASSHCKLEEERCDARSCEDADEAANTN
jgi:hypothetical protein